MKKNMKYKITKEQLIEHSACYDNGIKPFLDSGMDGVEFEWTHEVQIGVLMSGLDWHWAYTKGLVPRLDLRGADLRRAKLRWTKLRGADLRDADLRNADLWGADLSGADLRGAKLRWANLSDADLRNADLSDADLSGVIR